MSETEMWTRGHRTTLVIRSPSESTVTLMPRNTRKTPAMKAARPNIHHWVVSTATTETPRAQITVMARKSPPESTDLVHTTRSVAPIGNGVASEGCGDCAATDHRGVA